MSDVYDVIENGQKVPSNNKKGEYNKDEWVQRKKDEKDTANKLIQQTTEELKDENNMYHWINVQSQFDRYSVKNSLLILAQMPQATQMKEYNEWRKDRNVFINKKYTPVIILEPTGTYQKSDGTTGTNYTTKKMIDISETNA
ncbi:MAG: hypothetical protein FWC68_05045, partial [Oscillospiraceae bacterium]|nr:hypothetical protein [Oscillospiraceae bacterium]